MLYLNINMHALGPGLGSRSRSEQGVFGSLEPEPDPLGKKSGAGAGAGAGAAKKLAGSSAIRKLYFSYSSLGRIVSFYFFLNQLFYSLTILKNFLQFNLTSLRGKE